MTAARPEADDIREWLTRHPEAADPYTRLRIGESYDHVDEVLASIPDGARGRVLDVGCGTAFNSFAFATHFGQVTGIDASRRRVAASRRLVRRSGSGGRIRFERSRAESYRAAEPFDLVYCNIMSDLTRSRRALIGTLAASAAEDAPIFYAESCEGYAPGEMEAAIERRDGPELRLRLRQIVNGFCGRPAFRFFLAHSAERIFAQHGYDVVHAERSERLGLPAVERLWLRPGGAGGVSASASASSNDPDYVEIAPELSAVRSIFRASLRGAGPGVHELVERARAESDNRLAPFLVLLAMALEVPGARPCEAPWTLARVRDKAPPRVRPQEPAWDRASELLGLFAELAAPQQAADAAPRAGQLRGGR
jgi:SAM-dependent methyltransferase